jgi:hypothetical protein
MTTNEETQTLVPGYVGFGTFWLVVRRYRDKQRPLFMSADQQLAMASYQQHAKELRDGDIALWQCEFKYQTCATSGGYNRTQW